MRSGITNPMNLKCIKALAPFKRQLKDGKITATTDHVESSLAMSVFFLNFKGHSQVRTLFNITDSWFSNIDKRKINISIFLDLKKVFDSEDHGILLLRLTKYGIVGTPFRWFTSYLNNRKQYYEANNCSIWYSSGLVLGASPLHPVLYVNDFEQCFKKFTFNMYAYDTNVTCSAVDIDEMISKLSLNTLQNGYGRIS